MDEPTQSISYRKPFAAMTVLFFLWGFLMTWNDLLIPRFKDAFTLNYFQAMLVQFAYSGGYAVGSFAYYILSVLAGDPIARIGYKNGIVIGLVLASVGSLLFFPAAAAISYAFFLCALFVIGLGLAMLQIAANPYVSILGPERTASSRLNLASGFSSVGTTVGPIVGGWLIFQVFARPDVNGTEALKIPYLFCAAVFLLLAITFWFAHLPPLASHGQIEYGRGALAHRHTVLGVIAVFMYVGSEVSIGSSIVNFLGMSRIGGLSRAVASHYLSFYWGGLMLGRFMGSFALSDLPVAMKRLFMILLPAAAICIAALTSGWGSAVHYGLCLAILLSAFYAGASSPPRMLAIFSLVNIVLLATGSLATGAAACWAILGTGLFCSIMWSNIFSLAIEGLGTLKSQASSLLIMAILGAAIIPPIQGAVADHWGIQASFVVPMVAFGYVAFYGMYGYRVRYAASLVEVSMSEP
jgi:MFS transporter, FHS family, L-fucose permease